MKWILASLALSIAACAHDRAAPPAAPVAIALPRYTMDITLVPASHELRVTGSVVVPAPGRTLELSLMDAMTDLEVTSTPGGTLSAPSAPLPGAGNTTRTLTLASDAREVTIRFRYRARSESKFVYHIAEDAMFAGGPSSAWYPQLATGKALGTLRFHAPAAYTFVAGGTATTAITGDAKTTSVTYARPATFSFLAADYEARSRDGAVAMRTYTLRARPRGAALDPYLDGCSRALAILTREFGPYPFDGFALVELPDAATAAAGFSGASFEGFIASDSRGLDAPFNLAYFAHEIGHQWWGNLVTKDGDAGGNLLNEGLAQYGSLRAVEELQGPAAAETYRRTGYPDYNPAQSGLGFLRFAAAGADRPVAIAEAGYSPVLHSLANSKGLLAFDHLARSIGRDRFRAALHDVTTRYAFRAISWSAFQRTVAAHAGRDIAPFFAEWFERPGAPDFSLEWQPTGRTARGAILQPATPYTLELDVELSGGGRSVTRRVAIAGPRTPFTLDAPFDIEHLEIDPHFTVLHWTPEYRADALAHVDVSRATIARYEDRRDDALAIYRDALAKPAASQPLGARFRLHVGYARLLRDTGDLAAARAQLRAALEAPVQPPALLPWVHVELARIADAEHDRAATERHARDAITTAKASPIDGGAAAAAAQALLAH